MSVGKCPTCGELLWKFHSHKCKPLYQCALYEMSGSDAGYVTRADSPLQAAESYAMQLASEGDGMGPFEIFVRDGKTMFKISVLLRLELAAENTTTLDSYQIKEDE